MISAVSDILVVLVLGGGLSWLSQRLRFPNAVAQVVLPASAPAKDSLEAPHILLQR
jgi:hypothetical protein